MEIRSVLLTGLLCAAACASPRAHATIIDFHLTADGPQSWVYNYTVTNDTLSEPIEEFTIFFDRTLFENLSLLSAPVGWSWSAVFQPDPNIPDDGFFDAFADPGFGIAPGTTLGGFAVRFDFLGDGVPGAQLFDVVRAGTVPIEVIDSGMTRAPAITVPEPGTLPLLFAGVLLFLARKARRGIVPGWRYTATSRARSFGVRCATLAALPLAASPALAALVAGNTTLVASQRVTRTEWDYTYRITATNTGGPLRAVRATVTSSAPHTVVIDGELDFGDLAAGVTTLSLDTFTVRHNRSFPFVPSQLEVRFLAEPAIATTLEGNRTAEAMVGEEGGTLEAIAGDGTRFVLTIPPGSVQSPRPVRLAATPVASIEGLPASGGFLAGVQFEPDGLVLSSAATLRIESPEALPADLAAFHFANSGERFAFHPIYLGDVDPAVNAVTLKIPHFSAYGTGRADIEDMETAAAQSSGPQSFGSEIASILRRAAGAGVLTPELLAELRAVLLEWFTTLVAPALALADSFTALQSAVANLTEWEAAVQGVGIEDELAAQSREARQAIQARLTELFQELDTRCLEQPDVCSRGVFLEEFANGLVIGRQLLEGDAGLPTIESFCDGLVGKLPQSLTLSTDPPIVDFGGDVVVEAEFRGVDGRALTLSDQTLAQLGFAWNVMPAGGLEAESFLTNPLVGAVVEDTIVVTAQACGVSADAPVLTQIDITGTWSGEGTETVVCPSPDPSQPPLVETSSGSGSVRLTQDGSRISGSIEGTTISGTVTPGHRGSFTVSGFLSGVDEGVPFSATFSGSGSVRGSRGTLTAAWQGVDQDEEACSFSGSGTASR